MSSRMASALLTGSIFALFSCSRDDNSGGVHSTTPPVTQASDVSFWLTKGDQTVLLQRQNTTLLFGTNANSNPYIDVDSTQTFQTVDGFGYTLTGGSAHVISQMDAIGKGALLKELFGKDSSAIGISYLRLYIAPWAEPCLLTTIMYMHNIL